MSNKAKGPITCGLRGEDGSHIARTRRAPNGVGYVIIDCACGRRVLDGDLYGSDLPLDAITCKTCLGRYAALQRRKAESASSPARRAKKLRLAERTEARIEEVTQDDSTAAASSAAQGARVPGLLPRKLTETGA